MSEDVLGLKPLCIILVKSGAHGGKLLFKYPFHVGTNSVTDHGGEGKLVRSNPYSLVISEDLLNQAGPANGEHSNVKDGQLDGFSDETLANIFAVGKSLCGSKFELKLNDVRFVGYPISLEEGGEARVGSFRGRKSTITMFHIVFALKDSCTYSIIPCYHELSQRFGLILKHEEQRVGYLTQQMKSLIAAQDEVSSLPEDQQVHPFKLATERSHLAKDIQTMYHDLCYTGEVHLYINKWVELSFCLPQKVHRKHFPDILVEPESIYECLEALRPYHSLLLLQEVQELLDCLSTDASPALRRLVRQCSPLRSFKTLAVDTDLSLLQVFQLTGHLLYWGKATVIYPLCESNLYVLSPRLPTPLPHRLMERFSDRFSGDSLLETLSTFSLPCKLALAPPLPLHQPRVIEVIVWLLQHHLVIQLHTYVSLSLDCDMTFCCSSLTTKLSQVPPNLPSCGEEMVRPPVLPPAPVSVDSELGSTGCSEDSGTLATARLQQLGSSLSEGGQHGDSKHQSEGKKKEDILHIFSPAEQTKILSIPAAVNLEDLARFAHLSKYFQGNHHLEEIMYHENISRSVLLQLIDKFRTLLVKHEHEDPAVSMYFKGMGT